MPNRAKKRALLLALLLPLLSILGPARVNATVNYGYDPLSRLATALYDNGLCVVYAYDQNGNRTSQNNTISSPPESPVWGTGTWGCFHWTP